MTSQASAILENPPRRVAWIDVSRGIGIVLVVIGHVIAGVVGAGLETGDDSAVELTYRFICSFHMAVFLVIAGMLARRSIQKPAATFWAEKCSDILYPYLLWSVLQVAVQAMFSGLTSNPTTWRDFLRIAYDPPMQFWFLYCLLLGYAALYLVVRSLRLGPAAFFAVTLSIAIAMHVADVSPMSIAGRFRDNMLGFAFGVYAVRLLQRWQEIPSWLLALIAAGGFGAIARFPLLPTTEFAVVLVLPTVGALATFSVAELLVRAGAGGGFRFLGRLSMEIYLAHVLAYAGARIVLSRGFGVTSVPVHLIVGTAVGIAAPVALALLVEWLRIPYVFRLRRPAPVRAAA